MNQYAVIYCRVSGDDQEDIGLSLEAQEDMLRDYADKNEFVIVKAFIKKESAKRPGRRVFNEMLRYCAENEIENLLVQDTSRLQRNKTDDAKIEGLVKEGKLIVHLVGERNILTSDMDPMEEDWQDFKSLKSRSESRMIAWRVKQAIDLKLKKGEYPGSPPIGYKSVPRTSDTPQQIVHTEIAPKVKRFLETYASGKFSITQATKLAKDIGLRSRKGSPLTRGYIQKLIKNFSIFYTGEFEWKGNIYENKTAGYKPLITKKTRQKCLEALEKRSRQKNGRQSRFYKFKGLLTCANCGRYFYGFSSTHPVRWTKKDGTVVEKDYSYRIRYVCSYGPVYHTDNGERVDKNNVDLKTMTVKNDVIKTSSELIDGEWQELDKKVEIKKGIPVIETKCKMPTVLEEEIENSLLDNIGLLKFNNEAWQKLKGQIFADETREFLSYRIQILRSELTKSETQLDKLYNDYSEGVIDSEFYKRKRDQVRIRQTEVKKELAELSEERESYDQKIGKSIDIIEAMKNFREKWEKADDKKRNLIVKLMTIKILVDSDEVSINDKGQPYKPLQIIWNEEFNQLFELGIIEKSKEFGGGSGGSNPSNNGFNGKKNRDGLSDIRKDSNPHYLSLHSLPSRDAGEVGQ